MLLLAIPDQEEAMILRNQIGLPRLLENRYSTSNSQQGQWIQPAKTAELGGEVSRGTPQTNKYSVCTACKSCTGVIPVGGMADAFPPPLHPTLGQVQTQVRGQSLGHCRRFRCCRSHCEPRQTIRRP